MSPRTSAPGLAVLVGNPVGHSLSPAIHDAAARELGIDLTYIACRVETSELAAAVRGLWALGGVGANVTIPHKQAVLDLAASASVTARALGAANTLVRGADGWHADNTDVEGFVSPLAGVQQQLAGATAVVLGAGGAARAVVYGLQSLGVSRVSVAARRPGQAETLLSDLGVDGNALPFTEAFRDVTEAAIVVNATPVGTRPGESPWPDASAFRAGQIVYDLLYRPAQTALMKDARAQGATVIGGLPMLLAQAGASFRQWTGRDFPTAIAHHAALRALDE